LKLKILTVLAFCLILALPCEAGKRGMVKKGRSNYEKENYLEALQEFEAALQEDQNSDILNFNAGTAAYKNEKYQEAVEYFSKALLGEDDALKKKAYYNLGNSLYGFGISKEEEDLQTAVASLEKGIGEYEKVIASDPEDEDAKNNYEYVKKELERLKEKMEKQKSDGQCPLPKQEENEDEQQKKDQQQQDQSQENQDQKEQKQQEDRQDNQEEQEQQEQKEGQDDQQQSQEQQSSEQQKESDQGQQQQQQEAQDKEMTEQEAKMMLQSYQQNEEPKNMLNLNTNNIRLREVERNW